MFMAEAQEFLVHERQGSTYCFIAFQLLSTSIHYQTCTKWCQARPFQLAILVRPELSTEFDSKHITFRTSQLSKCEAHDCAH
jgi:hypothetical protein